MCPTIPTSPAMTPVSPHGAAGQQKQTLPYREDPHILCSREACQQPSLLSLFGMPYGHSFHDGSQGGTTWVLSPFVTTMSSTIPPSPAITPVSPHGAAGQQAQILRPLLQTRSALTCVIAGPAANCIFRCHSGTLCIRVRLRMTARQRC